ncbi:hypothetical protein [Nocardia arizonensis]|uniref:hypothetical protein n=1 Tax=Nocardia arizonensis TaxID=1141647 RepID=UPI0006D16F8E|nr:hypothetical protein [Nocardia arizonensis]
MTSPLPTAPIPLSAFRDAVVCAYTSLTRTGRPITWPVTPYLGPNGTVDITTGLAYPDKAERARHDARVALLLADESTAVLVQGVAAVRDADLQANADRYLRESLAKIPQTVEGMPRFLLERSAWYFARIYVQVTPRRIVWWPDGDLSAAPSTWTCAPGTEFPASDPAPRGPRLPRRSAPPPDWRPFADRARRLGMPVVSLTADGDPATVPVRACSPTPDGYDLRLPAGVPARSGPVCLTFHRHGPAMSWQENVVLVGTAEAQGADGLAVGIERALPDWSLPANPLRRARSLLGHRRQLVRRVTAEAARRGAAVPRIRRPVG